MEALLTQGFGHTPPAHQAAGTGKTPEARTARNAAIVAAIYLALVIGSPLIVRYGPSTDDHAMAALATRMVTPRCATAPEFGYPCPGRTFAAHDTGADKQPDL
jgi:hypothetical protein